MNQFEKTLCSTTKIEVKRVKYTWKICNYSSVCQEHGESVSSLKFSHSENNDVKWNLSLCPNGELGYDRDSISLYLHASGCSKDNKFLVDFNVCIIDSKQTERLVTNCKATYSDSIGYGFRPFTKKDIIQNKANGLLVNDTLTIVCKMTVKGNGHCLNCQEEVIKPFQPPVVHNSQFNDNLGLLLGDKEFTDVTLVASDKEFQVHKAILAAQSSVFMAMFRTDMKEKKESRVEIIDFNSDVISAMLHYVYTGKVKNVDDYSFDLLKIADKYAIDGLKSMSETMLHNKLNIKNAVKTLVTADCCNCHSLKTKVIRFIIAHKHVIIKSKEFEAIKTCNPLLVIEVLCNIVTS